MKNQGKSKDQGKPKAPVAKAPVVAPPPPPIVKPAVVASSGSLSLYADGSIGSGDIEGYNAGYSGSGQKVYGFFFADSEAVFPQITSTPAMFANVRYNVANVNSPMSQASGPLGWMQGYSASLKADGHGFDPKSVKALRGTLATRAKTSDIPAIIESARAAGQFFIQVEQGASGQAFP